MRTLDLDLPRLVRILRRRALALAASAGVAAAAAGFSARMTAPPPVFEAVATVRYERESTPVGLFLETVSWSAADEIESQAAVIASFPVLAEAARRAGLVPPELDDEALAAAPPHVAVLEDLSGRVSAQRRGATSLIDVRVQDQSPEGAAALANHLVAAYRDLNARQKTRRVRAAREFIEAQRRATAERLRRAEEELRAYRQRTGVMDPGIRLDHDLEEEARLRLELDQIEAALQGLRGTADAENPAVRAKAQTLADLEELRARLLERYTPEHPQVRELEDRIREAREALEGAVAQVRDALETRRAEVRRRLDALGDRLSGLPAAALGLARLEREVKVEEELYSLLASKHQEALIREAEPVQEVALVRPAFPPTEPVNGKNPVLPVAGGGIVGLLLGVFWVLGAESFGHRVEEDEHLTELVGAPVLAVLPPPPEPLWPTLLEEFSAGDTPRVHGLRRACSRVTGGGAPGNGLIGVAPLLSAHRDPAALELALAASLSGRGVALVDASFETPWLSAALGLADVPGLAELAGGTAGPDDVLYGPSDLLLGPIDTGHLTTCPALDGLWVVPAGARPASGNEFLATPEVRRALAGLRDRFEAVFVALPGIVPATPAMGVAPVLDGLVLACPPAPLPAAPLREAAELWGGAGGRVCGALWRARAGRASRGPLVRRAAWAVAGALTTATVGSALWVTGRLGPWGGAP